MNYERADDASTNDGGSGRSTPKMGQRRTLRQKLMEKLTAAADASQIVQQQVQTVDRKVLAIEMLVNGCPGAYVDFFFLTHKDLIDAERPTDQELIAQGIDPERHDRTPAALSGEAMRLLREHLTQAEACQRAGDVEGVYGAWEKAAQYFVGSHEYKTGAYFYAKCLHVASSTGWIQGEMDANLNLGLVSEQLGRMEDAVAYHERHMALAREHGDPADRDQAEKNLLGLYARQAEAARARGDAAAEERSLRQLTDAARASGNAEAEGDAHLRMGRSLMAAGQFIDALEALRRFLEVARGTGDIRKEGQGHFLIGQCLDNLRRTDEALASLEQYRRLSNTEAASASGRVGIDKRGVAEAACSMGRILFSKGKYKEASELFTEMYQMARAVKDPLLVNTAKVNLGVARGMAMKGGYLRAVREDLPALLAWKSSQEPFLGKEEFMP